MGKDWDRIDLWGSACLVGFWLRWLGLDFPEPNLVDVQQKCPGQWWRCVVPEPNLVFPNKGGWVTKCCGKMTILEASTVESLRVFLQMTQVKPDMNPGTTSKSLMMAVPLTQQQVNDCFVPAMEPKLKNNICLDC